MTSIDQKAYLQKYLNGPIGDKKKKKKKSVKGKGFKIIDDDIDLSKLRPLDDDELDILDQGEDAPQIAGIIDERPEDIRKVEQFKSSSKWRVINQDDGFNSKLQIQEIKQDKKKQEKENELIFGKMYSDSEDETKKDDDLSPIRKHQSPPRKNKNSKSQSPLPKQSKYSTEQNNDKGRHNSDSDFSPPRKERNKQMFRGGNYEGRDDGRHNGNSDPSPPRKERREQILRRDKSTSKKRDCNRNGNDSDLSPPRKEGHKQTLERRKSTKSHNKCDFDSDLSPPRQSRNKQKESYRYNSDSDLSPPRKKRSKQKYDREKSTTKRHSDSSPLSNKKMARTLEGKLSGLQNATQLREENDAFRKRESEAFNRMTDEVSGRNAKAVSRKSKRETSEDRQRQAEKAERQKQLDEKYKKWGRGLKQMEAQEARVQDFLHEAAKPLARHKDDRDLEDRLKDVEREGDPMLKYIRDKKRERGELGPERPIYKGSFPPNRFNIRPGYRWDGVDRSNGYEKKYFSNQSKRKAQEEEAYKWSTEDL